MKIPPRFQQSVTRSGGNPTGELPLQAGLSQLQNRLPLPHLSRQPSLTGDPLAALDALERWRAHEEDTRRHAVRWDANNMPIPVVIEPYPGDDLPVSAQALWMAIKQWEAASQGMIRFTLLEDTPWHRERAGMVLTWSDQTIAGRDFEVGHTQRTVQGKRITRVAITLIRNPQIDTRLSPKKRQERMYSTVLHETGHALGLEHSENPKDAMYYRGWQHLTLNHGDIQRIQQLYPEKPNLHG